MGAPPLAITISTRDCRMDNVTAITFVAARKERLARCVVALSAIAVIVAACAEDAPRTTGFRPSPGAETLIARKLEPVRRASLLRTASEEDPLPSFWNSCSNGWISSVKNQGNLGTCWAFASLATLETQLLKAGKGVRDFSEKNMVNMAASSANFYDGGNMDLAAGYLLRWSGPVDETKDVYVGSSVTWKNNPSPVLMSEMHIQNVAWISPLDGTEARKNALKSAIRRYGAVATAIGWFSSCEKGDAYYYYGNNGPNHAITVIGWDDSFPKAKFNRTPPGNGAWIIKNSWGENYGDNGFYHVSYHDVNFGKYFNGAVFLPPEEGENYDAVHGHDCSGPDYDATANWTPSLDCDLQAVVFTAAWNERLAAVGVWTTLYPNPYEISVYTNVTRHATSRSSEVECYDRSTGKGYLPESVSPTENGTLACRISGTLARPGFTTIPLGTEIPLEPGSSYAIVYRQTGSAISTVVSCCLPLRSDPIYGQNLFRPGNGYLGWTQNGSQISWSDAYDAGLYAYDAELYPDDNNGWALCIKAYTRNGIATAVNDMPGGTADGKGMVLATAATNATLFADTYSFESLARLVGANGRSLWANWLIGLDPSDASKSDFTISIDMSSGVPSLTLDPDLGNNRSYTVWGRDSLAPESPWRIVDRDNPSSDGARFFRVSIGQQ